jgi:hypothetical protein
MPWQRNLNLWGCALLLQDLLQSCARGEGLTALLLRVPEAFGCYVSLRSARSARGLTALGKRHIVCYVFSSFINATSATHLTTFRGWTFAKTLSGNAVKYCFNGNAVKYCLSHEGEGRGMGLQKLITVLDMKNGYKGVVRVGFIYINDIYNNDVGKGGVYAFEAYEVK